MLSRLIYILLFVFAFGFFLRNLFRLFALLCLGKWENRFDNLGKRLVGMATYAFAQLRVIQKTYGYNHLVIFWGFMILLFANSEFLISGVFPRFSYAFLGTIPYGIILTLTDFISLAVIVAVIIAVIRRTFYRPDYIEATRDAYVILSLIAALMIAYFGMNAGEIRLKTEEWYRWMPISYGLSFLVPQSLAHFGAGFWWWIHALVLLSFMNYLPYSKHLHIITAIPNCFFRSPSFVNTIPRMTFHKGDSFGISKITQFTWKDLLDFLSCTECGRCQAACPAHHTGKPLNPKEIIHEGKLNLFANGKEILASRPADTLAAAPENVQLKTSLINGSPESVSIEALWACTTCGACMVECPVFIEHLPKIVEMRRSLVMEKSAFPAELINLFTNTEQRFNPWGIAPTDRAKWAQDLNINLLADGKEVEYLFFVGCAGAFDSRNRYVVTAVAKILNAAGVSWGILGTEEKCCGDSLRRLGNEYVFDHLAKENMEIFKKYKIRKILTLCPHCFSTLKNDYRQYGADFEVLHHSQFIQQLLEEKKITLNQKISEPTVYHDSCYLGRYNRIFDEPRKILTAVSGNGGPLEMERNRMSSFCCGAGGGRMWMEESIGKRIYLDRTQEALKQNPSTIAVACPYCMTMFEDGVKEEKVQDQVKVKDIAEIVSEAMG